MAGGNIAVVNHLGIVIPDVAPTRPSNVIYNSVSFKIPNMSNWGASPVLTIRH